MIIIAIITVARFGIQFVVLMALHMKTRIGVVNLGDNLSPIKTEKSCLS